MEWWQNQQTREVILTEAGRICYDLTWRRLGTFTGLIADYPIILEHGGWVRA